MLPLSSSPSSYGTYQQVNTHGAEPACPLVPFGMSLSNVVQRSRVLLTARKPRPMDVVIA